GVRMARSSASCRSSPRPSAAPAANRLALAAVSHRALAHGRRVAGRVLEPALMAKDHTQFVCQACGAFFPRWVGRCTSCGAWNTLVEEALPRRGASPPGSRAAQAKSAAQPVKDVDVDQAARVPTGIGELDRVLGGGAVLGGVTLLGGDPGVGKSTLLLQALAGLAHKGCRALYVSGEESAGQTAARARRLGT